MKRKSLLLLISLVISACCLFTFGASKAQISNGVTVPSRPTPSTPRAGGTKQVPEIIRRSKAAGVAFSRRPLFRPAARAIDADPQLREVLGKGVALDLDRP